MKKKLLSILLCLVMVMSLLPTFALAATATSVTVGGVALDGTAGKTYWKNGDTTAATGTADDWNAKFEILDGVATLTLNNAVVTGAASGNNYGIYVASGDLTITLVDSSTVTGGTATSGNSCGVYVESGTLTISGDGSLVATGGAATSGNSYGVSSNDNLTISGSGSLVAVGGKATGGSSCGVFGGGVSISNSATVTAVGGAATNGPSYGVCGSGGSVTISGSAKVTATGGEAAYSSFGVKSDSGNVIISGGTVTAIGGAAGESCESCGISCSNTSGNSVKISGNDTKVTAIGGSYGVYGVNGHEDTIIYTGGLLVAKGGTSAANKTISTETINYRSTGEQSTADGSKYYVFSPLENDKPVYHVQVGNVTSDSPSGGVEDHITWEGKNLTLNNTIIIDSDGNNADGKKALTIPRDGTLSLEGYNVVLAGDSTSGSSFGVYGTLGGALTITGVGQLTAIGGAASSSSNTATSKSSGVYVAGKVAMSGSATVTAIGGAASSQGNIQSYSYGVYGGSNTNNGVAAVEIRDSATLTAIGGSANTTKKYSSNSYGVSGGGQGFLSVTGSNATLTAIGGAASGAGDAYSCGIESNEGRFKISGGTVTAIGGAASGGTNCGSYGVKVNMTILNGSSGAAIAGSGTTNEWAMEGTLVPAPTVAITGEDEGKVRTWRTLEKSTTPTATTTTVAKTAATQTSVGFTLTNAPVYADDQTWTVYTAATGSTLATGVTASNVGNTLTLSHETDIPAGNYYVSVTETGKAESDRLALTVGAYVPSSGNGGGGGATTPSAPVVVDGKTENIGKSETTATETKVTVDGDKLTEKVDGAKAGASVEIAVDGTKNAATAELAVKNVEEMAKKDMTLTVKAGDVSYELPTTAIDTAAVMNELGASDAAKVPVSVTIEKAAALAVEGATVIGTPTSFTVTASFGGKAVEVVRFDKFVARTIEVSEAQAKKITTAIVKDENGGFRHCPTCVYMQEGKWLAKISSLTNSVYALISNEQSFADASGKWYETAVNEMAGRKILNGKSEAAFDGDGAITRAEFAAIAVRALGLPADGKADFSDVKAGDWFYGAVGTAAEYGLITGYSDGSFAPNASITRQEAMVIVQRAAKVAEYPELANAFNITEYYDDLGEVADWASGAVSWNVFNGLIKGADRLVRPTDTITRAETATVVLRLLQNSKLVDVRAQV